MTNGQKCDSRSRKASKAPFEPDKSFVKGRQVGLKQLLDWLFKCLRCHQWAAFPNIFQTRSAPAPLFVWSNISTTQFDRNVGGKTPKSLDQKLIQGNGAGDSFLKVNFLPLWRCSPHFQQGLQCNDIYLISSFINHCSRDLRSKLYADSFPFHTFKP